MRFLTGTKIRILLAVAAILIIVSAFAVSTAVRTATHASAAGTSFAGKTFTLGNKRALNTNVQPAAVTQKKGPQLSPLLHRKNKVNTNATVSNGKLPKAAALNTPEIEEGDLVHNFRGLNSVDSLNVNGFVVEPPDQGLCVGVLSGKKVVFELVNLAVAVYTPGGALISGPVSLNQFFGEPPNEFTSDPRCYYDSTTKTFFFTMLAVDSFAPVANHVDIGVLPTSGAGFVFPVDVTFAGNTAGQCPCLGDQPKFGIDKNNIYISVDQFDNTLSFETGAALIAISKSQLEAGGPTINAAAFVNLSLNGLGITGLQPAANNDNTDVEYLLNAFPYVDAAQLIPNSVSNSLGLWTVTQTANVTNGSAPVLTETTITSQTYAFPTQALTTNGMSLATFTNDSRMQQVQFIKGHLWGALDSAVAITGDPFARDGLAWFEIQPQVSSGGVTGGTFLSQGIVASAGRYLLYPAIQQSQKGTITIAFSITSPTLNPSTGYVVRKDDTSSFLQVNITGKGPTPDQGFSCGTGFPQNCRWGDYSYSVLDPNGLDIWMAAERTVSAVATDAGGNSTNWGTQVWQVEGNRV